MNNIYGKISKEFRQLIHHSLKEIAEISAIKKGAQVVNVYIQKECYMIIEKKR